MDTTLEQFVKMTAMVHRSGNDFARMYAHFNIDEAKWHTIALHWMGKIGTDAALGQRFQAMMLAELERLSAAS
jgi:hypothetical protein